MKRIMILAFIYSGAAYAQDARYTGIRELIHSLKNRSRSMKSQPGTVAVISRAIVSR